MSTREILFATTNSGKLVEVRQIAKEFGVSVVGLNDVEKQLGRAPDVDETADTCRGNAAIKAEAYARWSGMPTIADDTGLEVTCLGNLPGVRSARYAGEHATAAENCSKLLAEMRGKTDRSARFICVLVGVLADGRQVVAEGTLAGEISESASGSGGFGYDSLFFLPETGMTLAAAKATDVQVDTHRIKALRLIFPCMGLSAREKLELGN